MLELLEEEYCKCLDDPELKREYDELQRTIDDKKNAIFDILDHPSPMVATITSLFENDELIAQLEASQSLTIEHLTTTYGIRREHLEEFYTFCKFQYDCGMYEVEKMLQCYINISQGSSAAIMGALWGRLACLILTAKWDKALAAFTAVKEAIESRSVIPSDQLRLRAWILHWVR